jgi:hypothetical protein
MQRFLSVLTTLATLAVLAAAIVWLLRDPRSPLEDHWNPLTPLNVSAPVTPFTQGKLRRALVSDAACFAALDGHAQFTRMEPLVVSEQCFIDPSDGSWSAGISESYWGMGETDERSRHGSPSVMSVWEAGCMRFMPRPHEESSRITTLR